ncbi:hypothetical protein NEOC65_002245 [Neochlamydia sp. AcF65]|nr:hypothetical protein [Neochlamydia sp. AcF65]
MKGGALDLHQNSLSVSEIYSSFSGRSHTYMRTR